MLDILKRTEFHVNSSRNLKKKKSACGSGRPKGKEGSLLLLVVVVVIDLILCGHGVTGANFGAKSEINAKVKSQINLE